MRNLILLFAILLMGCEKEPPCEETTNTQRVSQTERHLDMDVNGDGDFEDTVSREVTSTSGCGNLLTNATEWVITQNNDEPCAMIISSIDRGPVYRNDGAEVSNDFATIRGGTWGISVYDPNHEFQVGQCIDDVYESLQNQLTNDWPSNIDEATWLPSIRFRTASYLFQEVSDVYIVDYTTASGLTQSCPLNPNVHSIAFFIDTVGNNWTYTIESDNGLEAFLRRTRNGEPTRYPFIDIPWKYVSQESSIVLSVTNGSSTNSITIVFPSMEGYNGCSEQIEGYGDTYNRLKNRSVDSWGYRYPSGTAFVNSQGDFGILVAEVRQGTNGDGTPSYGKLIQLAEKHNRRSSCGFSDYLGAEDCYIIGPGVWLYDAEFEENNSNELSYDKGGLSFRITERSDGGLNVQYTQLGDSDNCGLTVGTFNRIVYPIESGWPLCGGVEQQQQPVSPEDLDLANAFDINISSVEPPTFSLYQFPFTFKMYRHTPGSDNVFAEVIHAGDASNIGNNPNAEDNIGYTIPEGTIYYAQRNLYANGHQDINPITYDDLTWYNHFNITSPTNVNEAKLLWLRGYATVFYHGSLINGNTRLAPNGQATTFYLWRGKWYKLDGDATGSLNVEGVELVERTHSNIKIRVPANHKVWRATLEDARRDNFGSLVFTKRETSDAQLGYDRPVEYDLGFGTACNGHCPEAYRVKIEVRENGEWVEIQELGTWDNPFN